MHPDFHALCWCFCTLHHEQRLPYPITVCFGKWGKLSGVWRGVVAYHQPRSYANLQYLNIPQPLAQLDQLPSHGWTFSPPCFESLGRRLSQSQLLEQSAEKEMISPNLWLFHRGLLFSMEGVSGRCKTEPGMAPKCHGRASVLWKLHLRNIPKRHCGLRKMSTP